MGYNGLIFGVTGNALQSDIDLFKESGANEVLTKPLDIQLLNTLMNSSAENAEKERFR
jgi:CheY-like chemotaxis protein